MLHKEISAGFSENNTKPIYGLNGENEEILSFKAYVWMG
jgi:hypothetical protein